MRRSRLDKRSGFKWIADEWIARRLVKGLMHVREWITGLGHNDATGNEPYSGSLYVSRWRKPDGKRTKLSVCEQLRRVLREQGSNQTSGLSPLAACVMSVGPCVTHSAPAALIETRQTDVTAVTSMVSYSSLVFTRRRLGADCATLYIPYSGRMRTLDTLDYRDY